MVREKSTEGGLKFSGQFFEKTERPAFQIDTFGALQVQKLAGMKEVINQYANASSAIYISGDPSVVVSALLSLVERKEIKQVNAKINLRGDKSIKGR